LLNNNEVDSLWEIWNNDMAADTSRLHSMNTLIKKKYKPLRSDSTGILIDDLISFSDKIDNHYWQAVGYNYKGNLSYGRESINYYQKSAFYADKCGDKKILAGALINTGMEYKNIGILDSALSSLNTGINICQDIGAFHFMANAYISLANIYSLNYETVKVVSYLQKAIDLQKKEKMIDGEMVARMNLASYYSEIGQHKKSQEIYQYILLNINKIKDPAIIASCYNNMATNETQLGNYNTASNYMHIMLSMSKELNSPVGIATAQINLADILYQRGLLDSSEYYVHSAIILSDSIGLDNGIAHALQIYSSIYLNKGDYASAIQSLLKAEHLFEKVENLEQIANVRIKIGETYVKQGAYEIAYEYFEKVHVFAVQYELDEFVGTSLTGMGSINQENQEFELAEQKFISAYEYFIETGKKPYVITSLGNLGDLMFAQKKFSGAKSYYFEAFSIARSIGNGLGVAEYESNIAQCYLKLGNKDSAQFFAKNSIKLSQDMELTEITKDNSKILFEIFKTQKQWGKSLEMLELHIQLRDSLHSKSNQKEIIRQEYKYEYEKQAAADSIAFEKEQEIKEIEIDKQKAEIKAKRNQQYALFGGLLLIAIFAGFMYNRFKITRKQKGIIEDAHFQLEEKNQEIMDSIAYAKRIQSAILPPSKLVKKYLPNSFILYKPKDIVAGDFYWMENKEDKILFAAADCTGHGVPGAMVSVVCNNGLNRSVREYNLSDPGKILDKTRELVIAEFEKSEEEVKDGMDIALCSISKNKLAYAGAHNPLWIIRNGEIIETKADLSAGTSSQTTENGYTLYEVKADKQPIGKFDNSTPFKTHTFDLISGDTIYIFSDGYVDQFGGEKGKKFKAKALRKLLLSFQNESMDDQKKLIDEAFEKWRGSLEQIDDVCVIGVRV